MHVQVPEELDPLQASTPSCMLEVSWDGHVHPLVCVFCLQTPSLCRSARPAVREVYSVVKQTVVALIHICSACPAGLIAVFLVLIVPQLLTNSG